MAVKVLRAAAADEQARLRFQRECHALGAVSNHPNIVAVHESGFTPDDGRAYLVMELCPAGSLADRIRAEGPLPADEVVVVGRKIGAALAVAHQAGVVHRDVKPANILVTAFGAPALADFGIARVEGGQHTATGTVTASFAHAAPEVLTGESPSPASDLYSLGSTLFALFAGYPPHVRASDESAWALVHRVVNDPLPDLSTLGMPEPLATVVRVATDKDPANRYTDADELVTALAGSSSGQETSALTAETDHLEPVTLVGSVISDTAEAPPVRAHRSAWSRGGSIDGPVRAEWRSGHLGRRGVLVMALVGLTVAAAAGWSLWSQMTALPDISYTFPAGASGPLDAGEPYDVAVDGGVPDARYRLVVDGRKVGNPSTQLRPYVPRPGRHSVAVEVIRDDQVEVTEAVEIYAIGALPAPGYRANLGSVTVDPENWARALERFDALVAEGHVDLRLLPSDRFPQLQPGFWNLFVPGFGDDRDAAVAYCAQYDLDTVEDCFTSFFDPGAS